MKKATFRVSVAAEPEADAGGAAFPRLLSFPQGVPIEHANMELRASAKGSGKKRKVQVSSEFNGVTLLSESDSSSKNDYYKFAVGVLDEATGVMTIHAADHAYVMRPTVSGRQENVKVSTLSYEAKRQSLTDEFGSRKKKRALAAAQSNTISAENISGAAAVETEISTSIDNSADAAVFLNAAEQALEQNRMQLLPAYDESATSLVDCYPIEKLMPNEVTTAIGELYDGILANNSADTTTSKRELSDIFMARFQGGDNVFISLTEGYHAAFHPSLPSELKKSDRKAIKSKICQVLLLEYMLWMYREMAAKFNKVITHEELTAALEDAPAGVFRFLTDKFSTYKKFAGKASFAGSKALRYKFVISHLFR
jgi:hypothetical protein